MEKGRDPESPSWGGTGRAGQGWRPLSPAETGAKRKNKVIIQRKFVSKLVFA